MKATKCLPDSSKMKSTTLVGTMLSFSTPALDEGLNHERHRLMLRGKTRIV